MSKKLSDFEESLFEPESIELKGVIINAGEVKTGYISPLKRRGRPKGSKNKVKDSAGVAPKAEQLPCKQTVEGSNPSSGSIDSKIEKIEKSLDLLTQIVSGLVDTKKKEQDDAAKLLLETAKSVQDKIENTNEPKINVNVDPEITINGVRYYGLVNVPISLANRLKDMMKSRSDMRAMEPVFVDHRTGQPLAILKG